MFGTGVGWLDLIVATIMAGLALQGAFTVICQSLGEMRQPVPISSRIDQSEKPYGPRAYQPLESLYCAPDPSVRNLADARHARIP